MQLPPMSLKAAFDKVTEGTREYIKVMIERAFIASPNILALEVEGTMYSLDTVFNLLGRAITRKELLNDLQKKINDRMGNTYIVRKIEGIHELIDHSAKEIELLNKMVRAILQKEVPYVVGDSSKSMDIPVKLESE